MVPPIQPEPVISPPVQPIPLAPTHHNEMLQDWSEQLAESQVNTELLLGMVKLERLGLPLRCHIETVPEALREAFAPEPQLDQIVVTPSSLKDF